MNVSNNINMKLAADQNQDQLIIVQPSMAGNNTLTHRKKSSHNINHNSTNNTRNKRPEKLKYTRQTKFQARTSRLDTDTIVREMNEFRGFFVLFWVSVGIIGLQTAIHNYRHEGSLLKLSLVPLVLGNMTLFAVSDLVMIAVTALAPIVHWMLAKRWTPVVMSVMIKYTIEMALLGGCVWWIAENDFVWSQAATLLLHSCVLVMKVHSYLTVNMEFELMQRRLNVLNTQSQNTSSNCNTQSDRNSTHSNESLQLEIQEINQELQKGETRYPQNCTIGNFCDFMLIPTLVYELEYPRTANIRYRYLFEKMAGTFGAIVVMYFNIEQFMYPAFRQVPNDTLIETLAKLLIPFMLGWLTLFYIIFEGVCNSFAEMTKFADRNFYDDWWNSCGFDEWARKWNKPVHEWLLRHVYLEAIDSYKVSKRNATLLTFFLSSVLHELVAAVVSKKLIFILFAFQMSQIVLIWAFRVTGINKSPLIGNAAFWICLYLGMPLIGILYARDYFISHPL